MMVKMPYSIVTVRGFEFWYFRVQPEMAYASYHVLLYLCYYTLRLKMLKECICYRVGILVFLSILVLQFPLQY